MSAWLKLYPPAWRTRYGDEVASLLEERPMRPNDRLDLVRGALDAWLHPAIPSLVPVAAALVGGGLWTVLAVGVLSQPAPPDWPGYLIEVVPLALLAAACMFVAAAGCALRAGGRSALARPATWLLFVGYMAWVTALAGTAFGLIGGAPLGAAQAGAMLGTMAIGLVLVRGEIDPIGLLLLAAPIALLVPSTVAWPAFGAAWTGIGIALWLDRQDRIGSAPAPG